MIYPENWENPQRSESSLNSSLAMNEFGEVYK